MVRFVRMLTKFALPICLLIACLHPACGADAKPSAETATELSRKQLTADTTQTTRDGATFVAPGGWWIETRDKAVILTPENDSRIALVDVQAKDVDTAVKIAWGTLTPKLKWALKLATDAPGREGWGSFRSYQYEVSPNEHRAVGARACKRGDAFTVA